MVEQLVFDEGTVWDTTEIQDRIVPALPTAFDDVLSDTAGADFIAALAGDDYVEAALGSDILYGNAGNDELYDYDSAGAYDTDARNYVDGGSGDDELGTDYGHSILIGGQGNDTLYTYAGNTLFAFNRGDGRDSIYVDDDYSWQPGQRYVLSLGGGIQLSELTFSNFEANNGSPHFNLATGAGDSIEIQNYSYSGLPIEWLLQIVGSDVRTYDLSAALAASDGCGSP